MDGLRAGNLALAFGLEIAMLAAFAVAGWAATPILWLRVVLAIGLPALAIVLWAVWAAPKAGKRRLKMPGLAVFKILIFAVATAAWVAAGQGFIGAVFGTLVVVNVLGMWVFGQW
jgi:hypothetical protein